MTKIKLSGIIIILFATTLLEGCKDLRTKKTFAEADRLEGIAVNNWNLLQELNATKHTNILELLSILQNNTETRDDANSLKAEFPSIQSLEIYAHTDITEPQITDNNDLLIDGFVNRLEKLTGNYEGVDKIKANHLIETIKKQNHNELIYYRGKYEFAAIEYNSYLINEEVDKKPLKTFSDGEIIEE